MKNLTKLYREEVKISSIPLLLTILTSGAAEGFMLGIVLAAAHAGRNEELSSIYMLIFMAAFSTFFLGKRYFLILVSAEFEKCVQNIRLRIADKIRKSELIYLEDMGIGDIFTQVTKNTETISQFALQIGIGLQSFVVLLCAMVYIAMLSIAAFFLIILILTLAAWLYLLHEKTFSQYMDDTLKKDSIFCDMLYDSLKGFKELKINQRKSQDHFRELMDLSDETEELRVKTQVELAFEMIFSEAAFFSLLGMVVFAMPLVGMHGEAIVKVVAGILFVIGPVGMLVGSIPSLSRMDISLAAVYDLEKRLDQASTYEPEMKLSEPIRSFEEIRFENILFQYEGEDQLFTMGPMDFSIYKGETLFIVGGNGSGKSTLLKLLTGLYYPKIGRIAIDGIPVERETYPAYRGLFTTIFSDFHLFNRLYGVASTDYAKADELLTLMQLDRKTKIVDGAFTNINLSTGQRKRLAMLVSLLDNKPICVFDEWAADQDPSFRQYFYDTLLKDIKAEGKTIIAVTHDDRYFGYADRVLKMEMGKFVE